MRSAKVLERCRARGRRNGNDGTNSSQSRKLNRQLSDVGPTTDDGDFLGCVIELGSFGRLGKGPAETGGREEAQCTGDGVDGIQGSFLVWYACWNDGCIQAVDDGIFLKATALWEVDKKLREDMSTYG